VCKGGRGVNLIIDHVVQNLSPPMSGPNATVWRMAPLFDVCKVTDSNFYRVAYQSKRELIIIFVPTD
jgi:hypothetical protein